MLALLPADVLRFVVSRVLAIGDEEHVDCRCLALVCRAAAFACRAHRDACRISQRRCCDALQALAIERLLDAVVGERWSLITTAAPLERWESVKRWRHHVASRFCSPQRLPCVEMALRGAGGARDATALSVRFYVRRFGDALFVGMTVTTRNARPLSFWWDVERRAAELSVTATTWLGCLYAADRYGCKWDDHDVRLPSFRNGAASMLHFVCDTMVAQHVAHRGGSVRGVARAWRHTIDDLGRQQRADHTNA